MKQIRAGEALIETQLSSGYQSWSGFRDVFSRIIGAVYRSYKPLFTIFAKYRALNFAGKSRKSDPKFVKNQ